MPTSAALVGNINEPKTIWVVNKRDPRQSKKLLKIARRKQGCSGKSNCSGKQINKKLNVDIIPINSFLINSIFCGKFKSRCLLLIGLKLYIVEKIMSHNKKGLPNVITPGG
jgi:hypothetical protein